MGFNFKPSMLDPVEMSAFADSSIFRAYLMLLARKIYVIFKDKVEELLYKTQYTARLQVFIEGGTIISGQQKGRAS